MGDRSKSSVAPIHTFHSKRMWGLITILVIGALFRAARLTESLWYDEIASWQVYCANATSPLTIMGTFSDPINHVFSNILEWCSVNALVGATELEIAFRLPSVVFSLLSIIAMYGLGEATGGRRLGLLAGGLMAVLPVAVLEGDEARGYSMMIFCAAASTWTLMSVLRRERRRVGWWVLYSILCALGVWSHFVTAFVPVGHAAWLAWRGLRQRQWRDFTQGLTAQSLAAILAMLLYLPMLSRLFQSRGMFFASQPDQPRILGPEGWHALLQLGGSWYWWAAIPGLLIGLLGASVLIRSGRFDLRPRYTVSGGEAVVAALMGFPIMLLVIAISGTWIYARFALFSMPGAILLMAMGIDRLWCRRRAMGFASMAIMTLASVADLKIRPPKQPLREAMAYVREHQNPGDNVLVIGLAHPVSLMYANDVHLSYTMKHGAELANRLAELRPRWIVVEYPRNVSKKMFDLIHESGFIEQNRLLGWADWGNGDIIVMRRPGE